MERELREGEKKGRVGVNCRVLKHLSITHKALGLSTSRDTERRKAGKEKRVVLEFRKCRGKCSQWV